MQCNICARPQLHLKPQYMQPKRFHQILLKLKERAFVKPHDIFSLVGLGEPLLYPWLRGALEMTHDLGNAAVLNTNAQLLDEENIRILNSCLRPNDILVFSVNASNDIAYRKYMNSTRFKETVASINEYLTLYTKNARVDRKQPHVYLRYLNVPENNLHEFRGLWSPTVLHNPQVKVSQHPLLHWHTAKPIYEHRYPCPSLWGPLVIDIDGNVYPCCKALSTRERSMLRIGNIDDDNIEEHYAEKTERFRSEHLNRDYSEDCLYCDFWKETRWQWKLKSKLRFLVGLKAIATHPDARVDSR